MAGLATLDRRWIFLVVGVLVAGLYAFGVPAEMPVNRYVQSYYDTIEALPEGSIVLLSADFDPASAAEIGPMFDATVHHLFDRGIRIVSTATWPAAPPYAQRAFEDIAPRYGKVYGVDWVELGYLVGDDVALGLIGQSLRTAYPNEARNDTPYEEVPLLREVGNNMQGIALLITASAGFPGILEWIPQVGGRYDVPLLAGTTAVQTPQLFAYYPNQLKGFLGAITGATQYLQLVGTRLEPRPDAVKGRLAADQKENQIAMLAQSWTHLFLIALIVVGNILYFQGKRRPA